MPQVVAYASKGGWSIALAQFDFAGSRPTVPRPSLVYGSKGTSERTAALKACTASSLPASSSSVCARTLVTRWMPYSGQQVEHLRVEDLPGELPGLLEDR